MEAIPDDVILRDIRGFIDSHPNDGQCFLLVNRELVRRRLNALREELPEVTICFDMARLDCTERRIDNKGCVSANAISNGRTRHEMWASKGERSPPENGSKSSANRRSLLQQSYSTYRNNRIRGHSIDQITATRLRGLSVLTPFRKGLECSVQFLCRLQPLGEVAIKALLNNRSQFGGHLRIKVAYRASILRQSPSK